MKPSLLLSSIAVACSREGWGIGEGMLWLFTRVAWTVVAVLAIAVISGVIVGHRKRAIARQVGWHLLGGVLLLIFGAAASLVGFQAWTSWEIAKAQEETAITEAWLAPLANPPAGELDGALAAVVDIDSARTPGRRAYLISALPGMLERVPGPLNAKERAAVLAVAAQLRQENTERALGSHPDNLDRLDAAAWWLIEKPDLPAALRSCAGRSACDASVLEFADRWCARALEACRAALDPVHLAAAEALVAADPYTGGKLKGIRTRLETAPRPAPGR